MAWTEGHLALMLTAITVARAEFFDALSEKAVCYIKKQRATELNTVSDEAAEKRSGNPEDLFTPQILVLCETIFALSQKDFSDPEKLRIFIQQHNKDMLKEREFKNGRTHQGVSKDRYEKSVFGKRAITGALYHWRGFCFRCDISFLQKVLGPLMSRKTCADAIDVLTATGYLQKEETGSSTVITSTGIFEPMIETYLNKIMEYGVMAKCLKLKK